jgi:hypothetical protein
VTTSAPTRPRTPRRDRERRDPRGRGDDGAVLVEAALVLPMLLLLVFGMIDFGVNLSDQIAVREGVREGVRQAVVDAPGAQSVTEVVALTKERIDVESDGTRVYVMPEASADGAVGKKGSNLSVCAYVPMRSLSGFYSVALDGRYMWSRVTMRVEQDLTYTTSSGSDAPPSGRDWSRCRVDG